MNTNYIQLNYYMQIIYTMNEYDTWIMININHLDDLIILINQELLYFALFMVTINQHVFDGQNNYDILFLRAKIKILNCF